MAASESPALTGTFGPKVTPPSVLTATKTRAAVLLGLLRASYQETATLPVV